jgi:amino acid adenylation domain-containing protein
MNIIDRDISLRSPELSAEKKALLKMRLQGAGRLDESANSIPRRAPGDHAPLSFAQQRLWFLDQLDPGRPFYNMPFAVRLRGLLQHAALQHALAAIVNRHEALRTGFVAVDGTPAQVIRDPTTVELPLIDLCHLPQANREAEMQRLVTEEIRRPFDLANDLLLRARLFKLDETGHVFVVTLHHIASDAWSLGVFFHELDVFYQACLTGLPAPLPDLKVQYPDFTLWQRERLQKTRLEPDLVYWRAQLANLPAVVDLPDDHPMPPVSSRRGALESIVFPRELAEALKSMGRNDGATLFMVLLAVFNVLLHRYTRQTDILVGSPIAGRNHRDTEGLIGFFINTLALRTDLSGNPTFREALQRVRQTTLDAYTHQELPFEKLVEGLKLERHSTHPPLLRAMVVLQSVSGQGFRLAGLSATPLPVHTGTAKFDLTLALEDSPAGLLAELEYNCDLFEPGTVQRLLRHFGALLEAVAADPLKQISALPLISPAEKIQVLKEWNNTRTHYPRDRTISQLFEEQVASTPDACAVQFGARSLTYRELNEQANQLAHRLRKLGVRPDALVAVSLERSLEMLVSLLGILKAGGAYVSLNSDYPQERLALMLEDLQPSVLLTHVKMRSTLAGCVARSSGAAAAPAPTLLCPDDPGAELGLESTANPISTTHAGNLAYVSFTSGSTGRPKGVCVPQRGVVRLVRENGFASFTAADIFLQLAPVSFDASTLEIWGALLNGAKLVVYPPTLPDLDALGEFIRRHQITTLWLTAGLFNQMVEHQLHNLRQVKQLLAGGDVLSVPHVEKALQGLPGCQLINGYGPTENTTFTCCHHVTLPLSGSRSIPIGRPIANTQVYVLDEHLQPAPIGIPGELFTGGDGLATGYLNRPGLTAEKFVPHPFATEPGARLYQTGDLVRWLPAGVIEFLGRIDQQVKLRGFRVEPGEIETALALHPEVRACAVAVRMQGNEKILVAYVAGRAQPAPSVTALREFLKLKLPDYMVPAAFVFLDSLPLSPNGKLDRQALPAPDQLRPELEKKYLAPRHDLERQMAQLWETVLGIQPVGVNDNFFELGGHSLMAVRLVAQIEKVFGKKIPVATVFQSVTVAQLVRVLGQEAPDPAGTSIVQIQPLGSRPPIFFVHGVGGGMFWGYTNLARYLGSDQPVYGFNSRGLRGQDEWGTIEEMATQYIADLRAVQPHGPYHLGGYCFGGNVAYEMARQLHGQGESIALLALINSTPPNSSYNHFHWTPLVALRFLKNFAFWIQDFTRLKPEQRREMFAWRLGAVKKKLSRALRLTPATAAVEVEEVVDLTSQPADRRALWKAHVQALLVHHPKPYAGHATLFRTRGHQFICSFDPQYGWGDLVAAGVTVKVVPGSHESILEEPNVQGVARELEQCLSKIQSQSSKVTSL